MFRLFLAVLAIGLPGAALAEHGTVRDVGGAAIHGPACRLSDCWAVVMAEDGYSTVVRGRGYLRTLRLAEEAAKTIVRRGEAASDGRGCAIGQVSLDL